MAEFLASITSRELENMPTSFAPRLRPASFAILIAALAALTAALLLPMEVRAQTDAPRCSFKLDGGESLSELPAEVDSGVRLYAQCRISQNPSHTWDIQSEIDGVVWTVDGESAGADASISLESLDAAAVVEMEGLTPWHKGTATLSEGAETYATEIAPSRNVRVITFVRSDGLDHRVEANVQHPAVREARAKLQEIEEAANEETMAQIAPLLKRANELIDGGRPWAAAELLASSEDTITALQGINAERAADRGAAPLVFLGFVFGFILPLLAIGALYLFGFRFSYGGGVSGR